MSIDQLKAVCKSPVVPIICQSVGANAIDIATIIGLIQKYGGLAEQLLAIVLPLVPAGGLADVLGLVLSLLQKIVPTS